MIYNNRDGYDFEGSDKWHDGASYLKMTRSKKKSKRIKWYETEEIDKN